MIRSDRPMREVSPNERGVYVITDAKWPTGYRFAEDKAALFRAMRNAPIDLPMIPYAFVRVDKIV